MRGKARDAAPVGHSPGITPAYAGKSGSSNSGQPPVGDHPRVCGEKLDGMKQEFDNSGITPAYAGKSMFRMPGTSGHWDHPRVCGEKLVRLLHQKQF